MEILAFALSGVFFFISIKGMGEIWRFWHYYFLFHVK
jgi:hypothetical protein